MKLRTILSALLALAILAALGFGAYLALAWAAGLLGLTGPFATATAGISLAIVLAGLLIGGSVRAASQRRALERLQAERAATYQLFATVWGAVARGAAGDSDELAAERRTLDRLLALYGSPTVIKAHNALCALEREQGAASPAVRVQFSRALLAIRADLGAEIQSLSIETLQQLFFADERKLAIPMQPKSYQDLAPRVSLSPDA
jgi:hypothetical protein